MPKKNADLVSSKDIEVAKEKTKKGLKSAFAIGCYNSETDNEIGRSKEHAKHMRRTRRQNFARKMNLIDPHYGKKAAGVLAAGTALGLAATTLPGVGAVAGPVVGGGVIASGLAFLETDAHRAVGDHAILDSLLDDRDDNWRTNTTLNGYDGHGDTISEFDRQQMLAWSDSDSEGEDLGNLLPPEMNERHQKTSTPATAPKSTNPIFDSFESDTSQTSATSATSMDFFDSMGSTGEPQKSTVPRPPSPGFGERQTNPHSSSAVQAAGNDYSGKTNLILDNPPVEDDFFASLTLSPTLEPSKKLPSNIPSNISPALGAKIAEKSNQANRAPAQPQAQPAEEDFFANFSGSSSSNNNSGSFFANVAAQIPSTSPKKPAQASDDNDDPFADLYARAKQPAPASNYNALQGMRKF